MSKMFQSVCRIFGLSKFGFQLALFCVLGTAVAASEKRPNILFLFADDQPPNCLGVMGNDHIVTPNIDRLARRGTIFNNAFATTAIWIIAAFVGPKTDPKVLGKFYRLVRPAGPGWKWR